MYQLKNFNADLVNQITAPYYADGSRGPNWANDCGESCLSMILKWCLNILVEPENIKDQIYNKKYLGYAYVSDLSNYLNKYAISTYYEELDDQSSALGTVRGWVSMGHPVIVLLYADREAQTGGHFCVAMGLSDTGGIFLANPWGGYIEEMTPAQFNQAYNGWLIHVIHTGYVAPVPVATHSSSSGVKGSTGTGTKKAGPVKYQVLTSMEARTAPNLQAIRKPIQLVNKGAVLDATGKWTPHWVQVVAGGHPVWLYNDSKHLKRVS